MPSEESKHYIDRDIDRIYDAIKELDVKMDKGFKTTHAKQDLTNGRVNRLEVRQKIIWGILIAVGGGVIWLAQEYLKTILF